MEVGHRIDMEDRQKIDDCSWRCHGLGIDRTILSSRMRCVHKHPGNEREERSELEMCL